MPYENPIPEFDDEREISQETEAVDYEPMREVYFAFIDVLGFQKTFNDMKISHGKEETKNYKNAEKYRDVFNYYFALMNAAKFMEKGKDTGCYAGQTSDSLYFYTDRTDFLMQFIKIFSHFNLYAMSKDVFFRGGIAKGALFKKEKYQFYGDSVIGAYLLESNISKNPIIMIDEQTNKDINTISEYNDLIETNDERHYIKPFALIEKRLSLDIDEDFIERDINVEIIKQNIESNKQAFEYDANNYSKYIFLQKKLNSIRNS